MKFKTWLMKSEVVSPGGDNSGQPEDLEALAGNIAKHGAGAFPQGGDEPPKVKKTAVSSYGDRRFTRRAMKKH